MRIRVITSPAPFVLPGDIPGSHDAGMVASLIAAATEALDGYQGRLGRCLAPQLVEWSTRLCQDGNRLPIGPVLEIDSIVAEDDAGAGATVDPASYRLSDGHIVIASAGTWLSQPIHRVRYWAGYGVRDQSDAWLESVPERVKVAVRLSVQHLLSVGTDNLFLSVDEVDGVGRRQYTVSDQASKLVDATCDRLISGLMVPGL